MTILLELDLTGALVEDTGTHPLEKIMNRRRLALRTVVSRLVIGLGSLAGSVAG